MCTLPTPLEEMVTVVSRDAIVDALGDQMQIYINQAHPVDIQQALVKAMEFDAFLYSTRRTNAYDAAQVIQRHQYIATSAYNAATIPAPKYNSGEKSSTHVSSVTPAGSVANVVPIVVTRGEWRTRFMNDVRTFSCQGLL